MGHCSVSQAHNQSLLRVRYHFGNLRNEVQERIRWELTHNIRSTQRVSRGSVGFARQILRTRPIAGMFRPWC